MKIELDPGEARVIGCLLEKEVTTPEQYPLSLNALRGAVNQKSNRDPVMSLDERQVQALVDGLRKKHLVSDRSGFSGGRVTKYKHRFCNTEFGSFKLDAQELGIVCLLLLRGPQTPGELRSRSGRLCEFSDVEETERVLAGLIAREDGPLVVKLAREPGRRESRYAHLFETGAVPQPREAPPAPPPATAAPAAAAPVTDHAQRLAALEREVSELRQAVDRLESAMRTESDAGDR